ncbi:MAG: S8 family serine peptidase, partial [Actinomycetota bacterium]
MKGLNKPRALILLFLVAAAAAISLLAVRMPSDEGDMADAQPDQSNSRGFNDEKPNPKVQPSVNELSDRDRSRGTEAAEGFARERGMTFADGKVTVVLEAATSAAEASAAAMAAGANVQATYGNLVQVSLPVANIDRVAAAPAVAYIREPQRPTVFASSEGVADIGAQAWQAAGQTGAGVKIAVLDPGFSGYQQRVASGDLPANVITASFRSDGDITGAGQDHGTACAELVYDVAPGAQLYLVNFSTDVELGNAVTYLTSQGVQVVSASWGFFGSFRGDGQGTINDMVAQARQAGITWANAAGNTAQQHWSGGWADYDNDTWVEFAAGDETNSFNIQSGARVDIYLTWDKWPATDQDYDLYLVWEGQPNMTVAASDRWQSGSQSPTEEIHYTVPAGRGGNYWIAIKKYSAGGNASFSLYALPYTLEHRVAAGSLAGQPTDSPNAMSVGAVAVNTTTLEDFSSQGPTVDGRIKPDIVA